jgi:putative membrane protein
MLRWFLLRWACNVVALWFAVALLSGVHITGPHTWTLIVAGFVFSVVNMLVKPLVTVLAIGLIILTLGLAYFLVNVLMLFLTSWIVSDFHIDTFWWGVLAAVIVWLVNMLLHGLIRAEEDKGQPAPGGAV